jgi:hypothetical protein
VKAYDLKGQRFDKLFVLGVDWEKTARMKSHGRYWLCRCDCGSYVLARACDLVSGEKTSCGCHKATEEVAARSFSNKKRYIRKNPDCSVANKYGCNYCADIRTCDFNCKYAGFIESYGGYAEYDRAAQENIYIMFKNFFEN